MSIGKKSRQGNATLEPKRRAAFEKLLMDSQSFYAAAMQSWDAADSIIAEISDARRAQGEHVIQVETLHPTGKDPWMRCESALTAATMNCVIAIELLLKGFILVEASFDEATLKAIKGKIGHDFQAALDHMKETRSEWAAELARLFEEVPGEVKVQVFYHKWSPPEKWVEDDNRLCDDTLEGLMELLVKECMAMDRYSFEDMDKEKDDYRIKLMRCGKMDEFHARASAMLLDKAMERGVAICTGISIVLSEGVPKDGRPRASKSNARVMRLSPKENWQVWRSAPKL